MAAVGPCRESRDGARAGRPPVTRRRVAVVGAGIGAEHLEGWIGAAARVEVAAVCDLDAARAAPLVARAREAGFDARHASDLDAVLADASIEVVDLCLPPSLHREAILRCLAAGRHVVCEKPLVASLAECDEVVAAEAASGRRVMPVFQYRFGAGFDALRRLIDLGLAGTPLVATLETHWSRDADYYAVPWRGRWASELGGAIVGHAIHAHDLLCCAFGPVAAVQASLATRANPIEVDDCAAIAFTMVSGALASSSVTLGASGDRSRLKLCFSGLTAESGSAPYHPAGDGWRFEARAPASDRAAAQAAIDAAVAATGGGSAGGGAVPGERYARQFALFARALDEGGEPPVTVADARASLELITAMYASHARGVRVALPLGADDPGYAGWGPAPEEGAG